MKELGYLSTGVPEVANERERVIAELFDAHYPRLKAIAQSLLGDTIAASALPLPAHDVSSG